MSLPSGRTALAWSLLPLAASFAAPIQATIYEDGSGGASWSVRDATPAGASVYSVDDDVLDGQVVETAGDGRSNAYLLGGLSSADGWNNTEEFHASFRLRANDSYAVYFRVDTADGRRWLVYNHSNRDSLGGATSTSIHHGLGGRTRDGRWRVFGRDLAADLADAQPRSARSATRAASRPRPSSTPTGTSSRRRRGSTRTCSCTTTCPTRTA